MHGMEQALVENLQAFIGFARRRVGDSHLAEDIVQESLVKALAAERQPDDGEDAVAWFYRILRRSIIDLYRRSDARSRAMARFEEEFPELPGPEEERLVCACFRRLLPALPESYRQALERIDLEGKDPGELAAELGLTRNNLTVRLHRARRELRDLLAKNCKACSMWRISARM